MRCVVGKKDTMILERPDVCDSCGHEQCEVCDEWPSMGRTEYWVGRQCACRNLVSRNVEGRKFGGEIGTRLINRGHRPRAGASHNGLEVFLNMKHYLIY
jgi:hypothetical protein